MNFIGSKKTLLPFLFSGMADFIGVNDFRDMSLCDAFSGTSIVGFNAMRQGYASSVKANDLEYFAYVLAQVRVGCYGLTGIPRMGQEYIDALNEKKGKRYSSYIEVEYANKAKYLTFENARQLDRARQVLKYTDYGSVLYYYVAASIIEAMDKVMNTASVHEAYLKTIKDSAMRPIEFKHPLGCFEESDSVGMAYNMGAEEAVRKVSDVDVLYLDPPYNSRRYSTNYHVFNTVLNLEEPKLRGVTRLPPRPNPSDFNRKAKASQAMQSLLFEAKNTARFVFVSYSDMGIIQSDEFVGIIEALNPVRFDFQRTGYKAYKADRNREYERDTVGEYLYRIEF